MATLSLKKKSPSPYQQFFRWKLTNDMHDSLDKILNTEDVMDVKLLVVLKNGEQRTVEV